MPSLVEELQRDALDRSVPVADLLRKAKVVATKLDLAEFHAWVNLELRGYERYEDIPAYRAVRGQVKGREPYGGRWMPMMFAGEGEQGLVETRRMGQAIGSLEELLRGGQQGMLGVPFPPAARAAILKAFADNPIPPVDVMLHVDRSTAAGILDAVRNVVLDWSLRLEREGIVGDGMTFSKEEKAKAHEPASTVNINIQNIENLAGNIAGSISGHTSVSAEQSVSTGIDFDKLRDFIAQVKPLLSSLPAEIAAAVGREVAAVEREANAEKPDESKVKAGLRTILRLVEGVATNLIASGIASQIGSFIG